MCSTELLVRVHVEEKLIIKNTCKTVTWLNSVCGERMHQKDQDSGKVVKGGKRWCYAEITRN